MLTRPFEDIKDLIIKFKSLGHMVSHLPVIKIKEVEVSKLNYSSFSGVIFTSANSVKFLNTKKIDKSIYCFCVGAATESKVLKMGFQNVYAADGNVENLKEIIIRNFDKKNGRLLYSKNSAKSLLNIIKKYELVDYWMNTNLMCLGEKTSSILNEIKWKKIYLFNPGEEEFLIYKI